MTNTNGQSTLARINQDSGEMTPLAPAASTPNFVVSVQEANSQIKLLQEFIRTQMVEGTDFGNIPGTGKGKVLFKPGAEKLNSIYGFSPRVEVVERVLDWEGGFIHYEVKVTLINKRSGNNEGEGVGSCNSRERRYTNQMAKAGDAGKAAVLGDLANTILKMAKKRALLDATLSATRTSGIFDLEDDLDDSPRQNGHTPARSNQSTSKGPRMMEIEQAKKIEQLGLQLWGEGWAATLREHIENKRMRELTHAEAEAAIVKLRGFAAAQINPVVDLQGEPLTAAVEAEFTDSDGDGNPFADE